MATYNWPSSTSAIDPVTIEAGVLAALQAFFPSRQLGQIYHDAAAHNITASFTEAGGSGGGTIPTGTSQMQVSSIIGSPIQLGVGANAGAAVPVLNLVPGGGPVTIQFEFAASDKLWVLTLDGSTVSQGCFVVNFAGPA